MSDAPRLLAQHLELITRSAILSEVAAERGYFSSETKAELARLGFGKNQCIVPSLVIPVRDVRGEIVSYQLRPDQPRIVRGKPVKYETPARTKMVVDVPLRACTHLADPNRPLFVTEGVRKADAAVSVGLCTIALLGVWNWRGTNPLGGKTALPDWEHIALSGRQVYVVFDSDVMTKPAVHGALARLKSFLEQRGATVLLIYLPPGDGAEKVGLDDFIAGGHGVQDLLGLASTELLLPEGGPGASDCAYEQTERGIIWHKPTTDSTVPVLLANFNARIVADVQEDDGAEVRRTLELEATLDGRTKAFRLPSTTFAAMNWAIPELGPRAVLSPGLGLRDHARVAIQLLSDGIETRTVYRHTGWRDIEGIGVCYLHAGGAIGPDGPVPEVLVELPPALEGYTLPAPVEPDRDALELLDLAPDRITFPGYAAVYRAVLGPADFGIHLAGTTGVFKTELAALLQQHWGSRLDSRHVPASWSSTGNSLEVLAFYAKDALLVVDDFAPTGSSHDIQRAHKEADRILRAQGNRSGRSRLRSDGSLAATRFPRGLILSTGEDIPGGHSIRARTLVVEVSKGDIAVDALTRCQMLGREGAFARTLAAFVQWLSRRYEKTVTRIRARAVELREQAQGNHARTPSIVGELQAGFEAFLEFGVAAGLVDANEAEHLRRRCWNALLETARAQSDILEAAEPTRLFFRLLQSALTAGKAHIASVKGHPPDGDLPAALGWRFSPGSEHRPDEWRPQGERVGWIDERGVYLDPTAAHKAAQSMGSETERLVIPPHTLIKRLAQKELLLSVDEKRGKLTIRKQVQGARHYVLHVSPTLLGIGAQQAHGTAHPPSERPETSGGPGSWAPSGTLPSVSGPRPGPLDGGDGPVDVGAGPGGPDGPGSQPPIARSTSRGVSPRRDQARPDDEKSRSRREAGW